MATDFNPEEDLEFTIDTKLKKLFKAEEKKSKTISAQDDPSVTSTLTQSFKFNASKMVVRNVFFDHQQDFFEKILQEIDEDVNYDIVEDLETLTKRLAGSEKKILFLYYTGYPRLCNKMIPLVRSKFPSVVVVLVAKQLTAQKVKEHRESDLAADDYLSVPFSKNDLFRVMMKYN